MAERLFPVAPLPEGLRSVAAAPPPGSQVGQDWAFDYYRGDFVIDQNGEVPKIEGGLTTAQQCVATLLADRAFHRMYTRRHGIDYELAMKKRLRSQTHASLEVQIRDRLKRIRGVKDVIDFLFRDGPFTLTEPPIVADLPALSYGGTYAWHERESYGMMEAQSYADLEKVTMTQPRTIEWGGDSYEVGPDVVGVRFTVVLEVGARYRLEITPHTHRRP